MTFINKNINKDREINSNSNSNSNSNRDREINRDSNIGSITILSDDIKEIIFNKITNKYEEINDYNDNEINKITKEENKDKDNIKNIKSINKENIKLINKENVKLINKENVKDAKKEGIDKENLSILMPNKKEDINISRNITPLLNVNRKSIKSKSKNSESKNVKNIKNSESKNVKNSESKNVKNIKNSESKNIKNSESKNVKNNKSTLLKESDKLNRKGDFFGIITKKKTKKLKNKPINILGGDSLDNLLSIKEKDEEGNNEEEFNFENLLSKDIFGLTNEMERKGNEGLNEKKKYKVNEKKKRKVNEKKYKGNEEGIVTNEEKDNSKTLLSKDIFTGKEDEEGIFTSIEDEEAFISIEEDEAFINKEEIFTNEIKKLKTSKTSRKDKIVLENTLKNSEYKTVLFKTIFVFEGVDNNNNEEDYNNNEEDIINNEEDIINKRNNKRNKEKIVKFKKEDLIEEYELNYDKRIIEEYELNYDKRIIEEYELNYDKRIIKDVNKDVNKEVEGLIIRDAGGGRRNIIKDVVPILNKSVKSKPFKWNKPKEIIELVKYINVNSEYDEMGFENSSMFDFQFQSIEKD